ncbi:Hypothetical predicted protein, partial [Pelobates cultripes]
MYETLVEVSLSQQQHLWLAEDDCSGNPFLSRAADRQYAVLSSRCIATVERKQHGNRTEFRQIRLIVFLL